MKHKFTLLSSYIKESWNIEDHIYFQALPRKEVDFEQIIKSFGRGIVKPIRKLIPLMKRKKGAAYLTRENGVLAYYRNDRNRMILMGIVPEKYIRELRQVPEFRGRIDELGDVMTAAEADDVTVQEIAREVGGRELARTKPMVDVADKMMEGIEEGKDPEELLTSIKDELGKGLGVAKKILDNPLI